MAVVDRVRAPAYAAAAYGAFSLLMIRTYLEHQAAEETGGAHGHRRAWRAAGTAVPQQQPACGPSRAALGALVPAPGDLPGRAAALPRAHRGLPLSVLLGRDPPLLLRSQGAGALAAGPPSRAERAAGGPGRLPADARSPGGPLGHRRACGRRWPQALAGHGVPAPAALDRRADYASVWREPGLVLSQTCGYPYATALRGRVQLVATPAYRAAGCDGARYCSMLLVRADDPAQALADLRGRRVAFNATDSQSGHNACARPWRRWPRAGASSPAG